MIGDIRFDGDGNLYVSNAGYCEIALVAAADVTGLQTTATVVIGEHGMMISV